MPQPEHPRVTEALRYAALGWPVVPLHNARPDGACSCGKRICIERRGQGKHPRTEHGLSDATTDQAAVRAWWDRWPTANVGLRTGIVFDALDIDGAAGADSLRPYIDEYGPLPAGPRTRTGGGGWHYLYHPLGIGNRVGFVQKVDWRGSGGYIVAPPSGHRSGGSYTWLTDPDDAGLPFVPDWLRELLVPKRSTRAATPTNDGNTPYGQRALDAEIAELARAAEGTRNHTLNAVAFNLAQLVAGGELAEQATVGALKTVAARIGLGDAEIEQTLSSGWKAGYTSPRSAPELRVISRAPAPQRAADDGEANDDDRLPAMPDTGERPDPGRTDPFTDLANAERLVRTHGHRFRYVGAWGQWLAWDGKAWCGDDRGRIIEAAKAVARQMLAEAAEIEDDKQRQRHAKWASMSQSAARIEAMVKLARSDRAVAVAPDELDADPWLLNCANGVLNLRTGTLGPHDPALLLTKIARARYDPDAFAPHWHAFLAGSLPDLELAEFIKRWAGYCLTGTVAEHKMVVAHGTGANGKTTLYEALSNMMGDYAGAAEADILLAKRNDSHPTGVADLRGLRLVVASESDEGRRLAEGTVKRLTGGDRIKARRMHQDFFEFAPTHKLSLLTNHRPEVRGTDVGIWRRLRLVPFSVTIDEADQDRDLPAKLAAEADGILAWAVQGCRDWLAGGLTEPLAVTMATAAYRAEQDTLGEFLGDWCVITEGVAVASEDLYATYNRWCAENGEEPMTQRRLGAALSEKGFDREKRGAKRRWHWLRIGLLTTSDLNPTNPS